MKIKLIALLLVTTLIITAGLPVLALLQTRQQAPGFSLPDYYSLKYHSLSDYRGKVVVIDFFGLNCGYCKEDSKNLATMYRTYYQQDSRVQFLCIESELGLASVQDTNYRAMVNSYAQSAGIPQNAAQYIILVGGQGTYNDYKCSETPTVYVLDKDGTVAKGFGYPIPPASVKGAVDSLLGSEPTPTPAPSLSITNVQLVPGHSNYLMWVVTYSGEGYAAIAPIANLYAATSSPPGYIDKGRISAQYVYDATTKTISYTSMSNGSGWAEVKQGHTYSFISGPSVPSDAKWATYNAQAWFDGKYHDSIYSTWQYAALR